MTLNKQAIGLDSKNKVRYVHVWTEYVDDKYLIHRESGLLTGKKTIAPDIEILKGKVKRTLDEQCELEFNSNFKKYLDKGYKDVSDYTVDELTSEKCAEILGDTKNTIKSKNNLIKWINFCNFVNAIKLNLNLL